MKSYKIWQEGWFSKKEPEDKDEKEPEDDLEDDKSFLVKNGLKGRKK